MAHTFIVGVKIGLTQILKFDTIVDMIVDDMVIHRYRVNYDASFFRTRKLVHQRLRIRVIIAHAHHREIS